MDQHLAVACITRLGGGECQIGWSGFVRAASSDFDSYLQGQFLCQPAGVQLGSADTGPLAWNKQQGTNGLAH